MEYLSLIKKLLTMLDSNKIQYCHWKSNLYLNRSANGENDLDLLVSINDQTKFEEIVISLGFKSSTSRIDFITPGIINYYGFDRLSGNLVNLHLHYSLMIGHDFSKNYHIPIEKKYLSSRKQNQVFYIPSTEFELIIFVIRMVIKHFTWETTILHQGKLTNNERNEFKFLQENSDKRNIEITLKNNFSFINPDLFDQCVQIINNSDHNLRSLLVGHKLIRSLNEFSRMPRWIDSLLIIWRRFYWPFQQRILHKDFRKKMTSGGKIIAIVGGDGAGKTTIVKSLSVWLGQEFAVRSFHMGKPTWSFLTILVRGILKIGTVLHLYPFQQSEIIYTNNLDVIEFPGYPWLIREICTARDRYLTYKKALKFSQSGGITILDRYPMQQIKLMDGPQISRMTINLKMNGIIKWLTALEEKYYRKIGRPDLIVLLKLDPQIAVERKKDEPEKSVKPRSEEISKLEVDDPQVVTIDASPSKETVLLTVQQAIWNIL